MSYASLQNYLLRLSMTSRIKSQPLPMVFKALQVLALASQTHLVALASQYLNLQFFPIRPPSPLLFTGLGPSSPSLCLRKPFCDHCVQACSLPVMLYLYSLVLFLIEIICLGHFKIQLSFYLLSSLPPASICLSLILGNKPYKG